MADTKPPEVSEDKDAQGQGARRESGAVADPGISGGVAEGVAATLGVADVDKVMKLIGEKLDITTLGAAQVASLREFISKSVRNSEYSLEDDSAFINAAVEQAKIMGAAYQYGKEAEEKEDSKRVVTENAKESAVAELNRLIRKKRMPTTNYESVVRFYQYNTEPDGQGGLIYTKGWRDRAFDYVENHARITGDKGGDLFTNLGLQGLRRKATIEEALANAKALGLGEYFEEVSDEKGEIKIKESMMDVANGLVLDDLLRARGEHEFLQKFDQKEALKMATQMIADVHMRSGRGVGEILGNDIILQVSGEGDGVKLAGSRLALPDIVCENYVGVEEQKAMDIVDFCMSVGCAGWQEMQNKDEEKCEENARSHIETVISNYGDADVKKKMLEIMQAGRPYDSLHNRQRFGFDTLLSKADRYEKVRQLVIEALGGGAVTETEGAAAEPEVSE